MLSQQETSLECKSEFEGFLECKTEAATFSATAWSCWSSAEPSMKKPKHKEYVI